jgi:glycosyltransferase involved in cell wall biosynthesis
VELIRPGVNGELFSPGDSSDLAGQLCRLADDREHLSRLATGAGTFSGLTAGSAEKFRAILSWAAHRARAARPWE